MARGNSDNARPSMRGCVAVQVAAPLCLIEAALSEAARATRQEAAAPSVTGVDPMTRWTLKRLVDFA